MFYENVTKREYLLLKVPKDVFVEQRPLRSDFFEVPLVAGEPGSHYFWPNNDN